jgi:ribosome-associated protein
MSIRRRFRHALAVVRGESAEETGKLHRIERLRAELMADEQVLLPNRQCAPSIDLQHLRSLRRAALLEQAQGKPPRSYRAIFRFLKELEQGGPHRTTDDEHEPLNRRIADRPGVDQRPRLARHL